MTAIEFSVNNQTLSVDTSIPYIISGSVNFVKLHFQTDENWTDLTKAVQFNQNDNFIKVPLNEDNVAFLPSELEAGRCTILLFGVKSENDEVEKFAATNFLEFEIQPTSYNSESYTPGSIENIDNFVTLLTFVNDTPTDIVVCSNNNFTTNSFFDEDDIALIKDGIDPFTGNSVGGNIYMGAYNIKKDRKKLYGNIHGVVAATTTNVTEFNNCAYLLYAKPNFNLFYNQTYIPINCTVLHYNITTEQQEIVENYCYAYMSFGVLQIILYSPDMVAGDVYNANFELDIISRGE